MMLLSEVKIEIGKIETDFVSFKSKINLGNVKKCEEILVWNNRQVELDEESRANYLIKVKDDKKLHPKRPLRGEIYMAEMGSNVGVEFKDYHPVIILQNNTGNAFGETTIVLPMTGLEEDGGKFNSKIHYKITNYDFESKVNQGLDKSPSKVKLADIATVDKARLKTKIGKLKPAIMKAIEEKVKKVLAFT